MRSKFLALNARDFFKGLIVAVVTAVITFLYNLIQVGPLVFDKVLLESIGMTAITAMLAYLMKNLFTNTSGEIATKEPVKKR